MRLITSASRSLRQGRGGRHLSCAFLRFISDDSYEGISWLVEARITTGRLFRRVTRIGSMWGSGITEKVVWTVVRECAARAGLANIAPHDLRRICARLCH